MSNTSSNNIQRAASGGSILRSLDWITIALYLTLVIFGWISVCGATYTFGETDIFSFSSRSGMQIIWIGTSLCLAFVILMLSDNMYDTFAYAIYIALLILLFATIFNPHEIKGSRSWIVLGPLRMQPAEFGKFATALAVSKFMSSYNFNMNRWDDFLKACGIIILPMLLIVAQKETGSALVFSAFFLMLFREGMSGAFLFTAFAMVLYFVIGIRFAEPTIFDTPTSIGHFTVLLMVQIFTSALLSAYGKTRQYAKIVFFLSLSITIIAFIFSEFVIPFDIMWIQLGMTIATILFLIFVAFRERFINYFFVAMFTLGSISFFFSADYVLNNVMQPHQRVRINVLLGLEEDLAGAGYNVHQSEIAIGSGGLEGKGFLNGTQTKLKYVPEQDTDFIFCTVGEEEGFLGCTSVLVLFLALILRLLHLAEKQTLKFARTYGYCVLSVFLFHVTINVGMVLGLTPVIGIPLPFFSYGGSSLWSFTILLFIFLRFDARRRLTEK